MLSPFLQEGLPLQSYGVEVAVVGVVVVVVVVEVVMEAVMVLVVLAEVLVGVVMELGVLRATWLDPAGDLQASPDSVLHRNTLSLTVLSYTVQTPPYDRNGKRSAACL